MRNLLEDICGTTEAGDLTLVVPSCANDQGQADRLLAYLAKDLPSQIALANLRCGDDGRAALFLYNPQGDMRTPTEAITLMVQPGVGPKTAGMLFCGLVGLLPHGASVFWAEPDSFPRSRQSLRDLRDAWFMAQHYQATKPAAIDLWGFNKRGQRSDFDFIAGGACFFRATDRLLEACDQVKFSRPHDQQLTPLLRELGGRMIETERFLCLWGFDEEPYLVERYMHDWAKVLAEHPETEWFHGDKEGRGWVAARAAEGSQP